MIAWVGMAEAKVENDKGYASVNAYLGKAEAAVEANFLSVQNTIEREYKNGKWEEETNEEFVVAEVAAGIGVSAVAANVEAGLGDDMLGIGAKAEGTVDTAKAEAKGKFSIGEDGINAMVEGEAMVAAAEGEVEGTIDILGFEIKGKVGGYAGALGVEGKVGIEDNKYVVECGASALFGVSAGFEIGLNDEGWDNFVDFITFLA